MHEDGDRIRYSTKINPKLRIKTEPVTDSAHETAYTPSVAGFYARDISLHLGTFGQHQSLCRHYWELITCPEPTAC